MGRFKLLEGRDRSMTFRVAFTALGLAIVNTACAGGSLGSPSPILDMDQAVGRALRENPMPATSMVVFDWSFRDPNADVQLDGIGQARLQDPDRARLDLFLDNGEAVLAAGLVEDELWAREEKALEFVPSPALLWAFLGTFRPGGDAIRLGGEAFDGDVFRLRFQLPDEDELRYEFLSGRMTEVEVRHDGDWEHRVTLDWEGGGEVPSVATYRKPPFTELKVTVNTVERVDSHPSDIWYLAP